MRGEGEKKKETKEGRSQSGKSEGKRRMKNSYLIPLINQLRNRCILIIGRVLKYLWCK